MIYSFDVYDTAVTRVLGDPDDVFLLMREELLRLAIALPEELAQNFPAVRKTAEKEARKSKEKEDIVLGVIYDKMAELYGLSREQVSVLNRAEVDIERRVVYPIDWTKKQLERLRGEGAKLVFVSDMYLPFSLIKDILVDAHLFREGDGLYVSSETGLTKRSGNLFRHIMQKEGCSPGQMTHCGDNLYSDICVPSKLGINIYGTSGKELERLLRVCARHGLR